jgi:hypothetical protein
VLVHGCKVLLSFTSEKELDRHKADHIDGPEEVAASVARAIQADPRLKRYSRLVESLGEASTAAANAASQVATLQRRREAGIANGRLPTPQEAADMERSTAWQQAAAQNVADIEREKERARREAQKAADGLASSLKGKAISDALQTKEEALEVIADKCGAELSRIVAASAAVDRLLSGDVKIDVQYFAK